MNEHTFVPKVNPLRSIRDIFLAARALPAGEERDRYLKTAVGDDPGLRQRVERMLASLQDAEPNPLVQAMENLNMDAPGETECLAIDVSQHPTIGPYKLLERLGTGGMGEVFVAEQRQPVRRNVALKLIKRGMDSREVVARFEAERQALAMMSHPNIASVLDAGQTEEGRPYFVMDLVRGIRITHYCDQHKLDLRQRLELMVTVCQAVQHAHHKGIIHRDLKPGNILVELDDVRHVPKVIDFGVAKATNQRLTERTLFTQFSQMIGTPLYMSPEQAQMTSMDVDTRSDVYSLGVVLYELLTGSTPFDRATLNKAGYDEMRRIIQEDEPPRPSQRISTLKAERLSTLTEQQQKATPQLERQVERELD
ncbi:MAG: serine/threonine protein kinase, partial [Planctomycetaceae bacterium]|nr:serine/threonine protein kinase [Planctomycetaceae bacterium]